MKWGMIMDRTLMHRVLAGILFLDMMEPGWRTRIDLDTLDVSDPRKCPLGQVYANRAEPESDGWVKPGYGYAGELWNLHVEDEVALGFAARLSDYDHYYVSLTAAWKELLSTRN